jgi:hypothetical protein
MPLTGQQLVEMSLEEWRRNESDAQQEFYQRLGDHATDTLEGPGYFPQAYAESDDRYEKRSKESLGVGASALEVLSSHMVGDGAHVTIGDQDSNEDKIYARIADANDLDGEHSVWLVSQAGTFGWCVDVIRPSEMPITQPEKIEFEAVDPRIFRAHYDTSRIGGSKRKIDGVSFGTLYDSDTATILPANTPLGTSGSKSQRVEIITSDIWAVYLDGEMAPVDPETGAMWQPMEDGSNPFGVCTAVPLWNVPQVGAMEGRADLDPAYKTAEQINRNYSRLLDNIAHYFATLVIPGDDDAALTQGLGLALLYPEDAPKGPDYIIPPFNVDTLLDPFKMQLNLFFSKAHTPASSHGLGSVFGDARAAESGKAKFYEFNRLERYIAKKRTSYERFKQLQWETLATFINEGTSIGSVDPNAQVHVEWASPIVPVSEGETVDKILKELEGGLISHLKALMLRHGISTEEAQEMIEEIGVSAGQVKPRDRFEAELEESLRGS